MSNTAGIDNYYLRGIRSLTPLSHDTFNSSDERESDKNESDEHESDELESDELESDEIYGVTSARNSTTGPANNVEVKGSAAHALWK